jgi:transcriptional regulator with XRE-family HTH domain
MPFSFSSLARNATQVSAGNVLRTFHIDARLRGTPHQRANCVVPPSASMISETVPSVRMVRNHATQSGVCQTPRKVVDKLRQGKGLAELTPRVVSWPNRGALRVDIADKDREEVAARLRALQQVLGASDQEMANSIGVSRQRWSNYVSRSREYSRMISIDGVRQLKAQFRVTSEWIFLGEAATLPEDLRRALNAALANPAPPKRPGRRANHK